MSKKNISKEKIIQSFLTCAFEKSAGATSLADISDILEIKKASLYNHFESRDAMYEATLSYCNTEISSVDFITEKTIENIKAGKSSAQSVFKRLITRLFNLYENEPLFAMYTFISSEKYFNLEALKTYTALTEKLTDEIKQILSACVEIKKLNLRGEKDIKEYSSIISATLLQQMDLYIANRKETVRQNPDCGAGSLFALPTDDNFVSKVIKLVDLILKPVSA